MSTTREKQTTSEKSYLRGPENRRNTSYPNKKHPKYPNNRHPRHQNKGHSGCPNQETHVTQTKDTQGPKSKAPTNTSTIDMDINDTDCKPYLRAGGVR